MNPLAELIAQGRLPNTTQLEHQPRPAVADPDSINATQHLIERLEANLTPPGPTQDPDWYGWIAFPIAAFLENMLAARHILGAGKHRFLDIGSGIGTKLILAHELGWNTTGIERWKPYADTSRRLAPFATIHHADAARYRDYNTFDLLYLYGIATDPGDHDMINRHITRRMRPGALFFCGRRPFPTGLEHATGLIWRKPTGTPPGGRVPGGEASARRPPGGRL